MAEFTGGIDSFSMPYSTEAEQSVLGAVLIDNSCMDTIAEILSEPEYFYIENHRLIYSVMLDNYSSGRRSDFVTVLNSIKTDAGFDEASAKSYLMQLAEIVPSVSNVEAYAEIIKEKYEIRSLISAAREIQNESASGDLSSDKLLDSAEQKIYDIRNRNEVKGLKKLSSVILETMDRLDMLNSPESDLAKPISTGIGDLDRTITGLNRSDLILLAARPGMGKTSFALNIAKHAAMKSKKKVVFFSLEMSREQLASRLLSSEALISGTTLRTGKLSQDEWERLIPASDVLGATEMYLDDTPGLTVPAMKAKLRRLKDVDLVIIDYLQLMSGARRTDNRVQEISEITRNLKIMAKEINVPVITLSQLSRESEKRADHRPQLSDLRDSGSIEQDADIVLFLFREGYYEKGADDDEDAKTDQNSGECLVAKNRHGETGSVKLHWQGEFMRFTSPEVHREG